MTREKEEKRRKEEKISPYLYRSGLVMECAALCHGSAREKKRNARKEKDRAAEIWKKKRRSERMREDVEFYLLENVWSYLRIIVQPAWMFIDPSRFYAVAIGYYIH